MSFTTNMAPQTSVNLDQEVIFLKYMHEDMTRRGLFVGPMIVAFKEGQRQAAVRCRPIADHEEDKPDAFREMMSIAATLQSDQLIFACDSWVVLRDNVDWAGNIRHSNDKFEVFNIVMFERETKSSVLRSYPYLLDNQRTVYYLQLGEQFVEGPAQGTLADVMTAVWEVEETGQTAESHAALLRDLGHNALLFEDNVLKKDWL